ncbi:MAG TPA: hypothetical protein PKA64_19980 [Myxococcota bacterium]|nr:hypothetical protein [Myxococcota bacterium]
MLSFVLLAACLEEGDLATPDALLAEAIEPALLPEAIAAPPGVNFTQDPLVPGQPVTFRVSGIAPGDRVYFTRSITGTGQGPCFPQLGNVCLGITSASLIGSDAADNTGTAELQVTLPANLPSIFVYTQAIIDSFAGVITTNIITAPILRGALDDDGDGFCEGARCHSAQAQPGDCDDTNPDVFPGQTAWFEMPYRGANGLATFDYDCDGQEAQETTRTYRCSPSPNFVFCQSSRDGWDLGVPACGEEGTWGSGCITYPIIQVCFSANSVAQTQRCH